ncbi:MAG TPA: RES family NAD+ phosphorylase [Verrucomicrobiae bacterium]|nr:RES family NAD+ phosphorylase [Verrucomicrobiae bacterium]
MQDKHAAGHWFDRHCYDKNRGRFFLTEPWEKLEKEILDSCGKRHVTLSRGDCLYRARAVDSGIPQQISAPEPEEARPGRFNPQGISCLYLSGKPKTAIAEAAAEADVLLARFEMIKEQQLVNTRGAEDGSRRLPWFFDQPREALIWECLSDFLSLPVPAAQEDLCYSFSRRLAAAFREKGFDGIRYPSAYDASGWNVALFDPRAAAPVFTEFRRVYPEPRAVRPAAPSKVA